MTDLDRSALLPVLDAIELVANVHSGLLPQVRLNEVQALLDAVDQRQALEWALTVGAVLVDTCAQTNASGITNEIATLRHCLAEDTHS